MPNTPISAVRNLFTKPLTCPSGTVINNLVYLNGADTVALASAAASGTANVLGFVVELVSPTTCIVQVAGENENLSGLTPGLIYYLSDTPGVFSSIPGTLTVIVGSALDSNTITLMPGGVGLGMFSSGAGGQVRARLDADFPATASTTLVNVTGTSHDLSVPLQTGKTYAFRAHCITALDNIGGGQFDVGGTCSFTALRWNTRLGWNSLSGQGSRDYPSHTALNSGPGDSFNGITEGIVDIDGTITVSVAGTLTIKFAQYAATGTSSVLAGAYMLIDDIT